MSSSRIAHHYLVDAQWTLEPLERAPAAAGGAEGTEWLDVQGDDTAAMAELVRERGFPDAVVDAVARSSGPLAVLPFGEAYLLRVTAVLDVEKRLFAPVTFLFREGLVITLHDLPLNIEQRIAELGPMLHRVAPPSAPAMLGLLLLLFSFRTAAAATALRDETAVLSRSVDQDSASVDLTQIVELKFAVAELEAANDDQVRLLAFLSEVTHGSPEAQKLIHIARTNAAHVTHSVDQLERRVRDVRMEFDSSVAERTNHRLNVLSIISAMFLPPTLIAGIFGMNFDYMPELHHPWGYTLALCSMAAVAGGSVTVFWRRGWFR